MSKNLKRQSEEEYFRKLPNEYWFDRWREEYCKRYRKWDWSNERVRAEEPKFELGSWFKEDGDWSAIFRGEQQTRTEESNGYYDLRRKPQPSMLEHSICWTPQLDDRYIDDRFPYRYMGWNPIT